MLNRKFYLFKTKYYNQESIYIRNEIFMLKESLMLGKERKSLKVFHIWQPRSWTSKSNSVDLWSVGMYDIVRAPNCVYELTNFTPNKFLETSLSHRFFP